MKLATIVGARPQFVKAAALSAVLGRHHEVLIHTGQHYDEAMSARFFGELSLPAPAYSLAVGSGRHGQQTGAMLEAIERVLLDERPDWVIVYGDTNSTLAGALAAAKLHIPVAHVEAGLRSFNRRMPEEVNRVMADHLSTLLFAPTRDAVENLGREGIDGSHVHLVGDIMLDASRRFLALAEARSRVLDTLGLTPGDFVLGTIHRAETTDDPARLRAVFEGLARVAEHLPVILPLHPRTRKALADGGLWPLDHDRLRVVDPVGYLDMLVLERHAAVIATDSGGVQKEAFFYEVPCVTLRTETEWVELVELGWNTLQPPTSADDVMRAVLAARGTRGRAAAPYGVGDTAERIVAALERVHVA